MAPTPPSAEGGPVTPPEAYAEEIVFRWEDYEGPVPPPDMIEKYQEAVPNGGDRLLTMAEAEGTHRREMENRGLRFSFAAHIVGQVLGFAVAIAVIAAGAWLINEDHSLAGFAVLLVGAGGLIRAVLTTR